MSKYARMTPQYEKVIKAWLRKNKKKIEALNNYTWGHSLYTDEMGKDLPISYSTFNRLAKEVKINKKYSPRSMPGKNTTASVMDLHARLKRVEELLTRVSAA